MVSRIVPANTRERWAIGAILLLATVLRVGWPTLTEFKFSEARLAALALELTQEGRLPLVGVPSSAGFDHSPLSVYLYLPAFLFSSNPISATIYGGLVGAAAVAVCWWLARRWPGGGLWAAFVAAGLFAVSPWCVVFSRKIWQVTFVPLLALVVIGLVISALVEARHWRLAWAVAAYAVLVQVHPSAISLVPALLLWLILFRRQVKLLPLLVGGLAGVMTSVPFLIHQVRGGWPAVAALSALPEAVLDLSAVRLGWDAITGRGIYTLAGRAYPLLRVVPELAWTFNLVGWLTVAAALYLVWRVATGWSSGLPGLRHASQVDLVLLCWLVVPLAFNLRHSLELYLHFFVLVAPAAYLVIGRAAQAALGLLRPSGEPSTPQPWKGDPARSMRLPLSSGQVPALQIGAVAMLAFLAVGQVTALVLMGRLVASRDTAGGFGTPLRQYLDVADRVVAAVGQAHAAEVLVVGHGDSPVVDETPAVFDVLFRGRVAYRFVDGRMAALFPSRPALALLTPDGGEATAWYRNPSWPSEILPYGYQLVHLNGAWPDGHMEPLGGPRLFQTGVEVQGHSWQGDAVAGGRGQLWLLWQVLWQSPADTHFFVHVVDQEGRVQGQQDTTGYPALLRNRGDRVVSKFDISIKPDAPDGPFGARAGLYLYPQVVNVPLIDTAGNPVGDSVDLGPLVAGPAVLP